MAPYILALAFNMFFVAKQVCMSSGSGTSQNIFGPISSHVDPFWHFCTFIVFFLTFAGSKQELYCRLYL